MTCICRESKFTTIGAESTYRTHFLKLPGSIRYQRKQNHWILYSLRLVIESSTDECRRVYVFMSNVKRQYSSGSYQLQKIMCCSSILPSVNRGALSIGYHRSPAGHIRLDLRIRPGLR